MKDLFINIIGRLDNIEVQLETVRNKFVVVDNDIKSWKEKFDKNVKMCKSDFDELHDELFNLDCRIIQNEQYSRRESLIISGIPDNILHHDLEPTVLKIIKAIGLNNISSYEITACHRLKRNYNDRFPAKCIVRFTNRKAVDFCLMHRERLYEVKDYLEMNLRFYESLCMANEDILKDCFKLKKDKLIHEYYLRNGFVKIIKNEGNRPIKIIHPSMLIDIFSDFYYYDDAIT